MFLISHWNSMINEGPGKIRIRAKLYAFRSCRSQCNQTLHGMLFRPEEGRGLLFDAKF
jgi:hypothetical protein